MDNTTPYFSINIEKSLFRKYMFHRKDIMKLDPKLCLIFLGFTFLCYKRIHFAESLKLDAKDHCDNRGYELAHYSNKGELCLNGEILESGVCTVASYRSDVLPDQNVNIFKGCIGKIQVLWQGLMV